MYMKATLVGTSFRIFLHSGEADSRHVETTRRDLVIAARARRASEVSIQGT